MKIFEKPTIAEIVALLSCLSMSLSYSVMTSPAMTQDPRLMSRPDLKYREVADERVAVTFLLAVRTDDRGSMEFLDYVDKHK